jgi:GntR family transcriptional regulator
MAKDYGICRHTVRQAIDMLVRRGMFSRRRGSGTYVREPGQEIDLFSLAGISSAFQRQGFAYEIAPGWPTKGINFEDDNEEPRN